MSERLTPEEQAEIRRHLEGLDGWLENRTRRLLDDLEALEKENAELATVKRYREEREKANHEDTAPVRAQEFSELIAGTPLKYEALALEAEKERLEKLWMGEA